jgi:hypothetical protein
MVPSDASLYIANHSGAAWYLAVEDQAWPGAHLVAKVENGASGLALTWLSNGERSVTVLDAKCRTVGVLVAKPDGSYALPSVHGLTATIEARAEHLGDQLAEGVEMTSDCGGGGYG